MDFWGIMVYLEESRRNMRLAAIYIKEHFLFDEPQTFNLGGKYIYKIDSEDDKIKITPKENPNYIKNFFGEKISLVSAIVGENGVGKTSILKELVPTFVKLRDEELFENIAFVCEINDDEFKVKTKLKLQDNSLQLKNTDIEILYYNPVLDFDLTNIRSSINPSNIMDSDLQDFALKILEYQLLFDCSESSKELKLKFKKDFPKLGDTISIKSALNFKDDFYTYWSNGSDIQKSTNLFLDAIFKAYPNTTKNYTQYTNDQLDLIKNVEVTILAILAVNIINILPKQQQDSVFTIDQILERDDFIVKLKKFRTESIRQLCYRDTFANYDSSEIQSFRDYLQKNPKTKNINKIISKLKTFDLFESFYNHLLKLKSIAGFEVIENNLRFRSDNGADELVKFIKSYRELVKNLKGLQGRISSLLVFDFFESKTNSKINLSNGEKSLLNLYSIIYDYEMIFKNKKNEPKNLLFLLDEADLGFHPAWKKRFVNSLVSVLPIIFKNCNIQIIFTTHDQLTLSDIPNNNIVYLKKDGDKTKVLKGSERTQKSFGANITDLLADSFFFGNEDKALIGDFAKGKIQGVIDCLNKEKSKKEEFEKMYPNGIYEIAETSEKLIKDNKKIIDLIDEPIMRNKLLEMYNEIFDGEIEIEREKKLLIKRAEELGLKIDYPKN